jgi:hypothetical protein
LPSSGAGSISEEFTDSAGAASGWGCALLGKLEALDAAEACVCALNTVGVVGKVLDVAAWSSPFAFGLVVSSAKSVGTSRRAIAAVEINCAARFIVAP